MVALATAFVEVRPDLSKFGAYLKTGADTAASTAGRSAGGRFSAAFSALTGELTDLDVDATSATTAGRTSGGRFSTAFKALTRDLADVDADTTAATTAGRSMGQKFGSAFKALTTDLTDVDADAAQATAAGRASGTRFGSAFRALTRDLVDVDADPAEAGTAGRSSGSSFASAFKTATPDLGDVDADRGQAAAAGTAAGSSYAKAFSSRVAVGTGGAALIGGAAGAAAGGTLALGAAAAATIGISVTLEAKFTSVMNQIQAATGAPQREIGRLSELAIQFGRDTVFSANDAADAILELAKGGIDPATIRAGALKGALDLAAAGGLDMATAAEVMVSTFGQFNLKGKDAEGVAAALAGAANASSADVDELASALSQGGLAADAVGFSVQETTGVLAAFANAGLRGSDAGTSMKTMLDRLLPASEKAEDVFEALGLQTEAGNNAFVKANGEFESAATIAERLGQSLEGLSSSERKKALSTIFGSDAQRAATVLAKEGGSGIREMIKATSDLGAAQRIGEARMKGTAGAFESLKGSAETVALELGQELAPAAESVFRSLADGLNALPGLASKVRDFFGNLFSSDQMGDFGAVLGDIGAELGKIFDAALPALRAGAEFIVEVFTTTVDVVRDLWDRFGDRIIRSFDIIWDTVSGILRGAFKVLTGIFETATALLQGDWKGAWEGIKKILSGAWDIIKTIVRGAARVVVEILRNAWDLIKFGASKLWDGIKAVIQAAWDGIKSLVKAAADNVKGDLSQTWATIRSAAIRAWDAFRDVIDGTWDRVKSLVGNAAGAVRDTISNAWGAVRDATVRAWDAVLGKIRDVWNGIKSVLSTVGSFLKDKVVSAFATAVAAIKGIWNKLMDIARVPVNFFIETVYNKGIVPTFNAIAEFLPGVGTLSTLPGIKGQLTDMGTEVSPGGSGRAHGGWTGPGDTYKPAGIVHADEFVIRKTARRQIEQAKPGLLDAMNRQGARAFHVGTPPHRTKMQMRDYWIGGGVQPLEGSIDLHPTPYYGAWYAADINSPSNNGTIRAWKSGQVARTYWAGADSYGNTTEINHDDGNVTLYAHQDSFAVRGGQAVKKGQAIGNEGMTGNASGPHLHFEISGGQQSVIPGGGGGGGGGSFLDPLVEAVQAQVAKLLDKVRGYIKSGLGTPDPMTSAFAGVGTAAVAELQNMLGGIQSSSTSGSASAAVSAGSGAAGIWKSLMSTGFFTGKQTAGVMGNMQAESGLDPYNIQDPGGRSSNPAAAGSAGYGLVQWTPGTKLLGYLSAPATVAKQVDALVSQLQGRGPSPEGAAGSALRATNSVANATRVFEVQYERPASTADVGTRIGYAENFFDQFAKTKMDDGGLMRHGTSALNMSGRTEAWLNPDETIAVKKIAAGMAEGLRLAAWGPHPQSWSDDPRDFGGPRGRGRQRNHDRDRDRPFRRRHEPIRIVLDIGGRKTLTGIMHGVAESEIAEAAGHRDTIRGMR